MQEKDRIDFGDCEKDALRSGVDELFASVREYASSDRFMELLRFTAHFKLYAPYNAMLIHIQRPGARYVLSARKWLDYNLTVAKDRCPIVILQPFSPVSYVYDVCDTIPIPGKTSTFPEELRDPFKGDPYVNVNECVFNRLVNNLKYWGILYGTMRGAERYAGKIEGATDRDQYLLFSKDDKCPAQWRPAYSLRVNIESSRTVQFGAIVHELGHLFCRHLRSYYDKGWKNGIRSLSDNAKEFEAETVSWLVCRRLGVNNLSYRYLANYFEQNECIPNDVSVDEILKATHKVEQVLGRCDLKEGYLYTKCAAFKMETDRYRAWLRRQKGGQ